MISRKEQIGCVYDDKMNLTHIVHWHEEVRTPKIYKVEKLGLEDIIDFLNNGKHIEFSQAITRKDSLPKIHPKE